MQVVAFSASSASRSGLDTMGCGASAVAPEGHVQEDTSSDAKQSAPHRRADDHLKMQDNTDGAAVNRKHELKRSQTSVGVPERRQSDTAESYHGGANFPQEVEPTPARRIRKSVIEREALG